MYFMISVDSKAFIQLPGMTIRCSNSIVLSLSFLIFLCKISVAQKILILYD